MMQETAQERYLYQSGDVIELQITSSSEVAGLQAQWTSALVQKVFEPVTMSPVMLVQLQEHPDPLVVKLYDRRCTPSLREENGMEPWSEEREKEYSDFVQSGEAAAFIDYLDNDYEDGTGGDWTAAQDETSLHCQCWDLYVAETEAYQNLQDLQGQQIPKLFGTVVVKTGETTQSDFQKYLEIQGVLLEYIQGFNLDELADHAPQEYWQSIFDAAVSIVNRIGDHGVLNRDVRPSNFVVRSHHSNEGVFYEPVMLDFAITQLRQEFESEQEWRDAKQIQDEERAIGTVMQHRLGELGFEVEYKPSYPYGWQGE